MKKLTAKEGYVFALKGRTCEVLNTLQYFLATIQDNPIWQGIQLGLSILTSVVLIAYRLWRWHNEATKDGKITKDEVEEGAKIINDGLCTIIVR